MKTNKEHNSDIKAKALAEHRRHKKAACIDHTKGIDSAQLVALIKEVATETIKDKLAMHQAAKDAEHLATLQAQAAALKVRLEAM